MTRRESLAALGAPALARAATFDNEQIRRHDEAIEYYLKNQVTDPGSRWRGALPDAFELHAPGTAIGLWEVLTAGFVVPQSRYYRNSELLERIELSAAFVDRSSSPQGNIYLPITNFNSPPDSAFGLRSAATTVSIARAAGANEILEIVEPRAKRLADAIVTGGIHTPNHRWVVGSALAHANELWPDARYVRRIDQWLAEGVDIDDDGQWSERSTAGYNGICCSAFTIMADKLKRPVLLDPVRKNLDAMLYLLHADGEVETGFSHRQDLNTRGTMAGYWFALQYLAVRHGERRFGGLAKSLFPKAASLSTLLAYPELHRTDFPSDPVPESYTRTFPHNHVLRIRRGPASVTVLTQGRDRFLSIRNGAAVIEAVRFATAFFGKGQFVPKESQQAHGGIVLRQHLEGPYFQPFDPAQTIDADSWDKTQKLRPQSEVCRLTQSAAIRDIGDGIELTIEAAGTDNVPLTVEINFREGGEIDGEDGNLFRGEKAAYRSGDDAIAIAGGGCEHKYLDVRGARPRLSGPSLFVTGYTPFRRTLRFLWS